MALDSLSTLYTSESRMPIQTLSIQAGTQYYFDFVLGYDDIYAVDISGQTIGRRYSASAFTVQMPNRSDAPTNQLTFGIGGVNMEIFTNLKKALGIKTTVKYREYDPDQHRAYTQYGAQMKLYTSIVNELILDLQGIVFSNDSAQFQASFNDTLNLAFPRLRYTQHNAPGLQYVS